MENLLKKIFGRNAFERERHLRLVERLSEDENLILYPLRRHTGEGISILERNPGSAISDLNLSRKLEYCSEEHGVRVEADVVFDIHNQPYLLVASHKVRETLSYLEDIGFRMDYANATPISTLHQIGSKLGHITRKDIRIPTIITKGNSFYTLSFN